MQDGMVRCWGVELGRCSAQVPVLRGNLCNGMELDMW